MSKQSFAMLIGWGLWLCGGAAAVLSQTPAEDARKAVQKRAIPASAERPVADFIGLRKCYLCHGSSTGRGELADCLVLRNEYIRWRDADRHTQAYAVLVADSDVKSEKLVNRMERILRISKNDPQWTAANAAECLSCHSTPQPPSGDGSENQFTQLQKNVTCEACHGPGKNWETAHSDPSWRVKPIADKTAAGMRNLRDPVVKTTVCLSCHLGNVSEGKVVTHDMYAAGHPPLTGFEVTAFARRMPWHWESLAEKSRVPGLAAAWPKFAEQYDLPRGPAEATREVLLGGLVELKEYLELLAEYAADAPATAWPELAMYDCFACHHDLQAAGGRQRRGYGGEVPGRPPLRYWPRVLAELAILQLSHPAGQETTAPNLTKLLETVSQTVNDRPFADQAKLKEAAALAAEKIDKLIVQLNRELSDKLNAPHEQAAEFVRKILGDMAKLAANNYHDYDSARQLAWAWFAVADDLRALQPNDAREREFAQRKSQLNALLQLSFQAEKGAAAAAPPDQSTAPQLSVPPPTNKTTVAAGLPLQLQVRNDYDAQHRYLEVKRLFVELGALLERKESR